MYVSTIVFLAGSNQQQREKEKIPGEGADADSNQFLTSIQLPYAMKIIIEIVVGLDRRYVRKLPTFLYVIYVFVDSYRAHDRRLKQTSERWNE